MIKGYIVKDEFVSVMKKGISVLEWLEKQEGYEEQLERVLVSPEVIFRQMKLRLQGRDDLFWLPDKITYYNSLTQRSGILRKEGWHLLLTDRIEHPFLYELRQLPGTLVMTEMDL